MRAGLIVLVGLLAFIIIGCVPVNNDTPNIEEPELKGIRITPGLVEVDNYYCGAIAEYYVEIENDTNREAVFVVSYRYPTRTKEGFSFPSDRFGGWLRIEKPVVIILPREKQEVLITLNIPEEEEVTEDFEFWVSVMEQGQGMIRTEMCQKWRVSMR